MIFNMIFQLLLVGSLAASFFIFMKGIVNLPNPSEDKCANFSVFSEGT